MIQMLHMSLQPTSMQEAMGSVMGVVTWSVSSL
jgi:hypothetical protein